MAFWPASGDGKSQSAQDRSNIEIPARTECIGRITCVDGERLILFLDGRMGAMDASFNLVKSTLVKIASTTTITYGVVVSLSVPAPGQSDAYHEVELAEIELVGEAIATENRVVFHKGVSEIPVLGDLVYLANRDDVRLIEEKAQKQALKMGEAMDILSGPVLLAAPEVLSAPTLICGGSEEDRAIGVVSLCNQVLLNGGGAQILAFDTTGVMSGHFSDEADLRHLHESGFPFWKLGAEALIFMAYGDHCASVVMPTLLPGVASALRQDWSAVKGNKFEAFLEVLASKIATAGLDGQVLELFQALPEHPAYQSLFSNEAKAFDVHALSSELTILNMSRLPILAQHLVIASLVEELSNSPTRPFCIFDVATGLYSDELSYGDAMVQRKMMRYLLQAKSNGHGAVLVSQHAYMISEHIKALLGNVIAFHAQSTKEIEVLQNLNIDKRGAALDLLPLLGSGQALIFGDAVSLAQRCALKFVDEARD